MKKKIAAILLALAMVVSLLPTVALATDSYNLWVGGVQVTSDNKADLAAGNPNVTGTVSYDDTTNTLTLNGANIAGATSGTGAVALRRGICSGIAGGLTIRLVGENTVTGGVESNKSYGISAESDLTITGDGTLDVRGKDSTDEQRLYASVGICAFDANVTITGGTVNAAGGATNNSSISGGESYGIWLYKFSNSCDLTVSGGTVNATGGDCTNGPSANSESLSCGIRGADTCKITVTGGTVTATGGAVTSEGSNTCTSCGIKISGTAAFSGGTVTATGGTYTNNLSSVSCGISANTATFSGTADVTASGDFRGIEWTPTSVDSGLAVKASTNKDGSSPTAYNVANFANYKYLHIAPPTHTHAVSVDCSESEGTQVTFTELKASELTDGSGGFSTYKVLPTGSYYLSDNVDMGSIGGTEYSGLYIPDGSTVNLCLNGYELKGPGEENFYGNIYVDDNATLNICDCRPTATTHTITDPVSGGSKDINGGLITGVNSTDARKVSINIFVDGTLKMYGGTIAGNKVNNYGAGVYVRGSGTFEMHGGEITYNAVVPSDPLYSGHGAGVEFYGTNFVLSGAAKIIGNAFKGTPNNVYLYDDKTITVSDTLTTGASIGITTQTAPTDSAPVAITGDNSADYSSFFASDNSDYQIVNTGTGSSQVVKLALPTTHTHAVSTDCSTSEGTQVTFTGINALTDAMPAGNYYLTDDVTLDESLLNFKNDVKLCLNGHTISGSNVYIRVCNTDGKLTICDCNGSHSASGGTITFTDISFGNALWATFHGTITMHGGTITGCTGTGGTVQADDHSVFTMYGGTIKGNAGGKAAVMAGNNGQVNINGGTITGNTNGGVDMDAYGSLSVSGTPKITGNTKDGSTRNVYLPGAASIAVSAPLTDGASIGVTTQTAPTEGSPVAVTEANTADYSSYFTSDNSSYQIYNDSNTVKLQVPAPTTYTVSFDANGGSGTMADVTGVSGSYTLPTCTFTAPSGKQFKAWQVGDDTTERAVGYTITVTANVAVKAIWEDIPVVKVDQTIVAADVSATYGDTGKKITVTASFGALSYAVKSGAATDVVTVDPTTGALTILKAGTTTVTVTAAGDAAHKPATKDVAVTVAKAAVTVTAKNRSIKTGEAVPDLSAPAKDTDYTVTGLLGSDTLTTLPTMAYQKSGAAATPDNTKTGSYDIVITGASAGGNYAVTHANGTLTISAATPTTPTTPSSSSGRYTSRTNTVTTPVAPAHGTVTATPANAAKGDTVTVSVTPDAKYKVDLIEVTDGAGNAVAVTQTATGGTFQMPEGKAAVQVTFVWDDPFVDVQAGQWFYGDVEFAHVNDMMVGVSSDHFAPEGITTRGMAATMLARLAGVDTDAGQEWYSAGVAWTAEKDIFDGTDPEEALTRELLATMLYRYEQTVNAGGFTGTWAFPLDFVDADQVSDWADEAMHWMTMNGVILGRGNGVLDPKGTATRAEVAAMFNRYLSLEK